MKKFSASFVLGILALAGFAGCSKDNATAPTDASVSGTSNVSMSITAGSGLARGSGTNAVEIQSAKVLLKNVSFHRFPSDENKDVKVGPFVVVLDLSGSTNTIAASNIPAGDYDRVSFRLHKPEDTEPIPDPEFRDGESGNQRYSVIVRGTYNGNAFVYRSRQNASQTAQLNPPITVTEKGEANVTMTVDPGTWFRSSGQLLDPNDSRNAQLIDNNIRASFGRAFKDNDRDGRPDF